MKIIVSHDVDHLYASDHLNDLIYPKLWVRETLAVLHIRGSISFREWILRIISPLKLVRHHVYEVMDFDEKHGVPSVFFFGMAQGLGMSYRPEKAAPVIRAVRDRGFDAGVHGIDYISKDGICAEHDRFASVSEMSGFGIRMHYVRFDDNTFQTLSDAGYLFDSSEFDKATGCLLKAPYKLGNMWEFPLCVMDTYLPYDRQDIVRRTLELVEKGERLGLPYFAVLFHDYHYCGSYSVTKDWYQWLIEWFISNGYEFISYRDAIKEMERD